MFDTFSADDNESATMRGNGIECDVNDDKFASSDSVIPAPCVDESLKKLATLVPFTKCLANALAHTSAIVTGNPASCFPLISSINPAIYS